MKERLNHAGYVIIALGSLKLLFGFLMLVAAIIMGGLSEANMVVPFCILGAMGGFEVFVGNMIIVRQRFLFIGLVICGLQLLAFPIGTLLCLRPFQALMNAIKYGGRDGALV